VAGETRPKAKTPGFRGESTMTEGLEPDFQAAASRLFDVWHQLKDGRSTLDGLPLGVPMRHALDTALTMVGPWIEVNVVALRWRGREDAILDDRRVDYYEAVAALNRAMQGFHISLLALFDGEPPAEHLEKAVQELLRLAREALTAISCLENMAFASSGEGGAPSRLSELALIGARVQNALATLVSLGLALRSALDRALAPPEEEENVNTARVRRYRDRKRRGVSTIINLELYEDDLELLKRFGYLDEAEAHKEDALAGAVQSFLLHGFLTHQGKAPRAWGERLNKQKRRTRALSERQSAQEQQ
jgi:hypothetical protein